jgi:opacity protein-like surface antigen
MRTLLKYSSITAIVLMICSQSGAQNALQMNIGYNVNIPAGDFRNLVTNPAYKGFTAGFAYPFNDQFSLGLSFGYNDYYQKYPRQVYNDGKGSDISAVVSNSIQQIPLMITANYTLVDKGIIRPYIGGGAGVSFINFDQYLGEFDNPQSSAKLSLACEAGVFIPLSRYSSTALKIGASYNYVPYKESGISNLDTWGIQAGIRFPLH